MKTSARLLAVLSLLQQRRPWTGPELAAELGVTARTIRNDMDRLRELGYPIAGSPGVEGGYRLRAGAELPPLLLDDEEAAAIAVGLRFAATGAIAGIEETSLRALTKLEQIMPKRVRRRVSALQRAIVTVPRSEPAVDADVLSTVAAACENHERLRFDYLDHRGAATVRETEPHRVVHDGRRWYLVAWDTARQDFRTFRLDRLRPRAPLGPRFSPRARADSELLAAVTGGIERATWLVQARIVVRASAADLRRRLPRSVALEPLDDTSCVARVGSDSLETLAAYLGMLGADFEVLEPEELRPRLRALGERYRRASRSRGTSPRG